MTLTQVWGSLLIFLLCPILGGLPLIEWITVALTRKRLSRIGTKNVSVSAAFYHGGKVAGILAVLSEALKGILAVLLARSFFPDHPEWELIALIALVFGRYWIGKGAGTTNVTWGYIVHDPITSFLTFLIGGIGFTLLRERKLGRFGVLILFPLLTAARHPDDSALIGASICLAGLMGWIYTQIPDDLELKPDTAQTDSQTMFKFFRGDRAVLSLDQPLQASKVGEKAATLAHLKGLGYPVPMGWVLLPGDDPQPLIELLQPSERTPLVVRSSAIGEDSELASAAGQYETILGITRQSDLLSAIAQCLASYDQPSAVRYRRDRNLPDTSMVVLIQQQVRGAFSGVAFSRDPIARQGDAVLVEALPGSAERVVSGQVTPESYQVLVSELGSNWTLPDEMTLEVQGSGEVPLRLVQQVAYLARHLEAHYHGIPQDIEWSYDGQTLWLLQSRPITTLIPIWTRKIAAEVIPGAIRPLTWSINRPLTCGVWGELFSLVLGQQAQGLDFNETATLHYAHAYFNASLLGQTFRRMGLPPESLEFLTRGAKFSKPPIKSTLQNVPGLLKLVRRELRLEKDFQRDDQRYFSPALTEFATHSATQLSTVEVLDRIDKILELLKRATYYSILAPLSAALRRSILKVSEDELDNSRTPEVAALRSLQAIATRAKQTGNLSHQLSAEQLFEHLSETKQGRDVLAEFDRFLEQYGYLSEVGTDIAIPTWREDPKPIREVFTQFYFHPIEREVVPGRSRVQQRVDLKGKVTEVYSRLLAHLRWSFVALEEQWLTLGVLEQPGDIFFLKYDEIRHVAATSTFSRLIEQRRSQFEQDRQLAQVPQLVYGDDPPEPKLETWQASQTLQGIGASSGQKEGRIKIMKSLSTGISLDRDTILVVPYTDSGWAAILAQVGGLISEVGGKLSHGAIVAREYRIPAVMDIPNATTRLHDGQQVRIDGQRGRIEIL
ncbi:MAG: glycerol-3-phosphate acyltransferase [Myxacorys chilensis ATA2-1-KO14]|jgi:pyruvate,water dikinase|nr:glycerol-3-phosphate acyltransferase [Myxacorys chilensis ATA2-1-KO14]